MAVRRSHNRVGHGCCGQPPRPCSPRAASGPVTLRRGRSLTVAVLITAVAVVTVTAACSRETAHRVLVFLYDGVPPLDVDVGDLKVEMPDASTAIAVVAPPRHVRAKKRFYNHLPYRENRCGECHEGEGRGLLKTARQGLCQTCHHEKPVTEKKNIHGPVATNGCLVCHTYHRSVHPKLLLADAQTLCFHCHEMSELRTDEHHATIEEKRCIDCHDAHGGDDRFFLLPGVVTEDSP